MEQINLIYGNSVISRITGDEVVVMKIGNYFISGYVVGSACTFPRDYRESYYGFKILSFLNIKK